MKLQRNEQEMAPEPNPLGVQIDSAHVVLWEEYARDKSLDEMYGDWRDPSVTNPGIRNRMVVALTTPRDVELPYIHPDQSISKLLHITEDVDGQQTSDLRTRLRSHPELATELAQGILFWLSDTTYSQRNTPYDSYPQSQETLSYWSAAHALLPLVDETMADELYGELPLNDPESFSNFDDSSGYRPLQRLLGDQDVPMKYKQDGLTRWITIATEELDGIRQPRDSHEAATRCMQNFLRRSASVDNVEPAIIEQTVDFLDSITPTQELYAEPYLTAQIAAKLADEDLRLRFAWRHAVRSPLGQWNSFSIRNDEDAQLLDWLAQRVGDTSAGEALRTRQAHLVEAYIAWQQQEAAVREHKSNISARLRQWG